MRDIEKYVNTYEENNFEMNVQVKYRRNQVIKCIEDILPESVLEIGCGLEPVFKYISMEHITKMTIVEPGREFYMRAQQCIDDMGLSAKVNVVPELFEKGCELLKSEYDMIICSGLLHEVEEPKKLLKCIRSVCNEQTIIHINVPNAYSIHRLWAYESGMISDIHDLSNSNHLFQQSSVFDLKSLTELVTGAGFNIMSQGAFFCKPFTHNQMQKLIETGIVTEQMLDGLDKLVKYMPEYGSEIYINAKASRKG